jgi:integrase
MRRPLTRNLAGFSALQLSAGVHFMQVSQWLGHATYSPTLDVYGDYIPETDGGAVNSLREPTSSANLAGRPKNVVPLFGRLAT